MATKNTKDQKITQKKLMTILFWSCIGGLLFLCVALVVLAIAPFCVSGDLTNKFLAIRLSFFGVCTFIATLQLILGVLLALTGVNADYDAGAGLSGAKIRLVSSSPGILLIVCANIILGICISRNINLETKLKMKNGPNVENTEKPQYEAPLLNAPDGPE